MVFIPLCSLGQSRKAGEGDWKSILSGHSSKSLHDTLYLNKAGILADQSLKDPELKAKLSTYREIAWSDIAYQRYRVKYYALLSSNATQIHEAGFSIYYLQKHEEELKKTKPYINSLNEPRMLLAIYGSNAQANITTRIGIFQNILPFLESLPELIASQKVPANTCMNAMTILYHASQIYAGKKDTLKVYQILYLANDIYKELEKKSLIDEAKMQQFRLLLYMIEYAKNRVSGNPIEGRKILNTANALLKLTRENARSPWQRAFERSLLIKLIDFNISQNQLDSSKYYFGLLKYQIDSYKENEPGDGTKFLLYSAKINAKEHDYKSAYDTLLNAYKINDSIISLKTADIHNNMYAHMVAEQRNEELLASELQKSKRSLYIFVIVSILAATIASFILYLRIKNERIKRQIEELNNMTQIQIAELEANANMIQKKLGMEIHDGIAGRLVHICNFIETEILDERDQNKRNRLKKIGELAKETYSDTRSKSQEWYIQGAKEELAGFSRSVDKIVSLVLPKEKYEQQIEIDDLSLEKLPSQTRIHLLRIIQEAITNVIKHAKASKVKLFIYEEDNSLNLQIIDNGKGFDKMYQSKTKSIGLLSLRNRIEEMNGSLDIVTSSGGTEILCIIPI